ncbi:MAG: cytochrome c-type biosis protein CcmH [Pseudomonadota bacterium]|jgi:cytochrome c-type biogenesis protein CcmH|nr:cytochrome c-type biosis protein CcmH [Pseudomonadota bacterium]MDQ1343270.1 cytochrome c-type biosis protein CcmH [Pseudomonadota bacterium]
MIVAMLRASVVAVLLVLGGTALAIDAQDAFDDPVLQERYENINRELRCLVCQNQTIADSNATLAQDLRREVRDMIAAGQTDAQIREFMIERYGDFVLYRPRMTAGNLLLWAAPVLLLVIGAIVLVRVVRRRAQETDLDADGPEAGQS